MNQEQLKNFLLKMDHDLSGQKRCLDLVYLLLIEGVSNIDDAKKLLAETIEQFELTQKFILKAQAEILKESKPENGISLI